MRLVRITTRKDCVEWINLDAVTVVTYLSASGGPERLELILFNGSAQVTDSNEIKEIALILGIVIPAS